MPTTTTEIEDNDVMSGFEEDNLDYRGPDYFDPPETELEDSAECALPGTCLMTGVHLRSECRDLAMVRSHEDAIREGQHA